MTALKCIFTYIYSFAKPLMLDLFLNKLILINFSHILLLLISWLPKMISMELV